MTEKDLRIADINARAGIIFGIGLLELLFIYTFYFR